MSFKGASKRRVACFLLTISNHSGWWCDIRECIKIQYNEILSSVKSTSHLGDKFRFKLMFFKSCSAIIIIVLKAFGVCDKNKQIIIFFTTGAFVPTVWKLPNLDVNKKNIFYYNIQACREGYRSYPDWTKPNELSHEHRWKRARTCCQHRRVHFTFRVCLPQVLFVKKVHQ